MDLINTATSVATPLAAICLFASLIFLFLRGRSSAELKKFEMLNPDDRKTIADDYLSRYGMRLDDVDPSAKVGLARDEMAHRQEFRMRIAMIAFAAFVILLIASGIGFALQTRVDASGLVETLEGRASVVKLAIDDAIANRSKIEGAQAAQAEDEVSYLKNMKRTFEQLHGEYIRAVQAYDIPSTHRILPKIMELLADAKLMGILNLTMQPVYETKQIEENGIVKSEIATRFVPEITSKGDDARRSYSSSVNVGDAALNKLSLPGE